MELIIKKTPFYLSLWTTTSLLVPIKTRQNNEECDARKESTTLFPFSMANQRGEREEEKSPVIRRNAHIKHEGAKNSRKEKKRGRGSRLAGRVVRLVVVGRSSMFTQAHLWLSGDGRVVVGQQRQKKRPPQKRTSVGSRRLDFFRNQHCSRFLSASDSP
jgi:hypothetical protein